MSPSTPVHAVGALRYALVALNRPLDPLTYLVPERLAEGVHVGSIVRVPLRSEVTEGVVLDLSHTADVPERVRHAIKPIVSLISPDYTIGADLIELARWIAQYYFCSLGEALASISMVGLNEVGIKTVNHLALSQLDPWRKSPEGPDAEGRKPTAGHQKVIRALLAEGNAPQPAEALKALAGVGDGVLKTMLERGWLSRVQQEVLREDDYAAVDIEPVPTDFKLTPHQKDVFEELSTSLHAAKFQAYLLHGVTGSGKTEIYLRLIEDALRIGRTAIVLVPEISLTPQIVEAFRRRLGRVVGIYHSKLSLGQKLDLYRLIVANEVRVVIGARSALFSPLPRLGVVIVDEEHESSYKQGETPRYHARDVAVLRASRAGAVAVLGSATPSVESLHNAREGKYIRLSLPERVGPHASPLMTVVDMKRHIQSAGGGEATQALLSPTLIEAIGHRLERHEQTVLLLNRRGFANHVLCLKCEKQIQCPNCDVSMTYHKTVQRLLCHWCGHRAELPQVCPHCGAEEIQVLGFGTQRIEEALGGVFPGARLLRIDMDSMRRKGAFAEAWRQIVNHEVDIILGTQMIAKGLHLESVTLVGVISADFALFLPDFRAAERTYALLTQVAGRAGRGQKPGEVILQSFMPHHYAIDDAARLAEDDFYRRELHQREMMQFPPFTRLAALILTGPDEDAVRREAWRMGGILKRQVYRTEHQTVRILGPTPAPIARLEGMYRWRLLARSRDVRRLHTVLGEGLRQFHAGPRVAKVNLTVDVDPVDLM